MNCLDALAVLGIAIAIIACLGRAADEADGDK